MKYGARTVSDLGEKAIIERLLRPLFNPGNERNSIGDDCAALEVPSGAYVLVSTDRVPADLIAFKTGVITHRELGRYLGVLNLSDIAACGGLPTALLFNCGLPASLLVDDLIAISLGLQEVVTALGAKIVGGDITASSELSLSATVVGYVEQDKMLRRSGAKCGDTVFVSREIGLTPTALDYCLNRHKYDWINAVDKERLEAQFKQIRPELTLGRALSLSGRCTSCMDNTDGVGQSLLELARESNCAFRLNNNAFDFSYIVNEAAKRKQLSPMTFAMGPGADFGLVGTLDGYWSAEAIRDTFGSEVRLIGEAVEGRGVYLQDGGNDLTLPVAGWDYFRSLFNR